MVRIPYFLIILLAILAFGISPSFAQRGPSGPVQVFVSPATLQSFSDQVEALGTTKANETVVITADTSEKIAEIHFEDGQEVKKGDLLVTLDKGKEEAELSSAEAQLAEAQSAYDRALDLQKTSALSKAILQERQTALKQSQAALAATKARLDELEITAPFDGILGLRQVSVGTLVQPGDWITTIDDLSQIKVDFDIPSVYLSSLQPGLPIVGMVEAFGQRQFRGEIRTINTQIDPVTRTIKVRAILPNPDHTLKPGLLMTITLFKNQREALLIPEEALMKRGEKNFVYIAVQDGNKTTARLTEIKIGGRQPGFVEVLSGLQSGDKVVNHGIIKLYDGAEIAVKATETEKATLNDLLKQGKTE